MVRSEKTAQLGLPFVSAPRGAQGRPAREVLVVGRRTLLLACVRHPRAKHYLLRVEDDGSVRVTIPRRGTRAEALRFVREKVAWIERERYRVSLQRATVGWVSDTRALVNGEWAPVEVAQLPTVSLARFAGQEVPIASTAPGLVARAVQTRLRNVAERDLPPRLRELASTHGYEVSAVTIRDQRSRWGSCSPSARISLNWRLVQMPPVVRDYILLHELAHLRHPDHSRRFWRELERLCPWHVDARRWLNDHAGPTVSAASPLAAAPLTAPGL